MDMTNKYNRLTESERDLIGILWAQGRPVRAISRALKRSPSSISREIRRNSQGKIYIPRWAQKQAKDRRSQAGQRPRLKDPTIRAYVEIKLKQRWSPELIAGKLKRDFPLASISHEAIYQWIYTERRDYIPFLTRKHRRRNWRGPQANFRGSNIPSRVSIDQRPALAASRKQAGHWEADTVMSSKYKRASLQVLSERKTRYTLVTKLEGLGAVPMRDTLIQRLKHIPSSLRRTITYDNGTENAGHTMVNYELGTQSYFCHPYHSWEKGTVENAIGLIRRFFPKKTNFETVTYHKIKKLEQWLNHRPRKCLNFQTPYEVFKKECCA